MIDVTEFTEIIRDTIKEEIDKRIPKYRIGTIATDAGKPTVQFAGEDQPSQKEYSFLGSYTPNTGDRVLLAEVNGTFVVLGKINQDQSGSQPVYIVEEGETDNGTFIRYSNGIQECFTIIDLGDVKAFGNGTIENPYRTGQKVWSYPKGFIETPSITAITEIRGLAGSDRAATIGTNTVGTSSVQLQAVMISNRESNRNAYAHARAIGRWK